MLDRNKSSKAGIDGLLFSLTLQAEPGSEKQEDTGDRTSVTVDYSTFDEAYGGGFASRLRMVELPACALTTPGRAACRESRPLDSANDTEKQTLTTAAVNLRPGKTTVLAATAGAAGDKGDYKATALSPSATWSTDLNTGDFSWSYDMQMPQVPGGLEPTVGLSYSSGAIDGRTSATNNQSSWVGDGFDLWPGFIERRYKPCSDDGVQQGDGNKPGDLCWGYDNATISFNGKGGELVPTGKDEWKLRQDDGTRIKHLKAEARGNGDNDDEYWEVTDPEGTRYYFGYHRLNGWATGKETTDSTWTVPVYGDDSGEPCHASAFTDSWCQQAWRWNLDYVVDTHGNAIAYYYDKETNSYGRNLKAADDTPYTRGGYLDRIEYGLTSADAYADKALAKVTFSNTERCIPTTGVTCAADTIDSQSPYWYDTPWDLNCKAGTDCDQGRLSPTFWTRKRLTAVTSEVLTGSTYSKVDSWNLEHRWGTADVDYQLLLDSIKHTGHTSTTPITLPKTTFAYAQMANRLDKTGDGIAPFIKSRLATVADEFGGQTDANYSAPACSWASLPTPHTNASRCFPQYIGGDSSDDPSQEWFNKYVVDSVTTTDRTGGAPDQVTRYTYLGGAAWHYDDDDGLTKEKFKTWSQWRGYGHVRVQAGGQDTSTTKSQEDHYFLRGMNGDRKDPSGGTKAVEVALADGEGAPITDHHALAGFAYKTATFSGPDGKVLEKEITRPWHHQTAERVRSWGTITADFTGASHTRNFISLDDGAGAQWRTTSVATQYDTVAGRPTQVDNFGDDSTAADNQCTRTTYTDNSDANILHLPSRAETVAVKCAESPDRTKNVIADVRTAYDNGGYGETPVKGDLTATATLKQHDGSTATYLEAGRTVDRYGRELTSTDLTATVTASGDSAPARTARTDGRTTTTAYIPATGFANRLTVTTPPAKKGDATTSQTTTNELHSLRGLLKARIDANGKRTEFTYDALGRTSRVWLANRTTSDLPSHEFTYFIEEGQPVAVRAQKLNKEGNQQIGSYTLYDGLLRPRQTQEPGPDSGRILTDTFYDDRGLATKAFAPYYTEGNPNKTLFKPDDALSVETQTHLSYDGLGREIESKEIAGNGDGGTVLSTTRTHHHGDRVITTPPDGGTATTTLTDARGRTTELRQHHGYAPDAAYDTTRYRYNPSGQLAEVTDPAGNAWTYTYDQLGRTIRTSDPDKGTKTSVYDDRGQLISTTDARNTTLTNTYDGLGRRTELREGGADGTLRAAWVYDTVTGAKGQLAESTRYVDGKAYTNKITVFDRLYQPMKSTTIIPDREGALAGSYQSGTAYSANGMVAGTSYSAAGSLPGGGASYTHEAGTLRLIKVTDGQGMAATTTYSPTGKPLQYELGGTTTGGKKAWVTNTYEWGTQRLATSRVDRQDVPGVDRLATYGYDPAGNVTSVSDTSRSGTDTQCFRYDYLRRLTEAWTQPTKTCANSPSGTDIGGPAPYWHSYTYDKVGNRLTETLHDPTGNTAKDTQRKYTYPPAGSPRPHTLTKVDTSGPTGASQETYGYDEVGNTETRTLRGDTQELVWDAEGHLSKVTEPVEGGGDQVTEYLYDADGNRLIGRTPTETTLYLGHTEVTLPQGAATPKATRYLDLGGGNQAVRSDDNTISLTLADHHGTAQLAIDGTSFELSQRHSTPFGASRGEKPASWPGTRGFVGGTIDATTDLTHLGAREYDPAIGRFISVDPIMDLTDPQQIHGYTYANSNPMTFSDPTGLWFRDVFSHVKKSVTKAFKRWTPAGRMKSAVGRAGARIKSVTSRPFRPWRPVAMPQSLATEKEVLQYFQYLGQRHKPEPKEKGFLDYLGDAVEFFAPDPASFLGCGMELDRGDCFESLLEIPAAKPLKFASKVFKGARSGRKAAKEAPCDSFVPGTVVLLAGGKQKNIEEVAVGDEVTATDPETGETNTRKVVATIVTEDDKHFTDLTVTTDAGDASIIATDHHPFWDVDKDTWTEAGDIEPGTRLRTPAGDTVTVETARHFDERQRTHNLTVSKDHTYYVLAGAAPVLVHNCGEGKGGFFSRLFGKRNKPNLPEPNATVGDLRGVSHDMVDEGGAWSYDPMKRGLLQGQNDEDLLRSVFDPDDEARSFMTIGGDGQMMEGNHRMAELISRASDPRSSISWDTPIYIRGWG